MVRQINKASEDLIKSFEGLVLKAAPDIVGVPTVGWGHTGPDVHNGMVITEEMAEELFKADMVDSEQHVQKLIHVTLNYNQFGAIVSLVFNVGPGAITGTNLAKLLNLGKFAEAADGILKFDHAGGRQVRGLTRRRQAERALFLKPVPK